MASGGGLAFGMLLSRYLKRSIRNVDRIGVSVFLAWWMYAGLGFVAGISSGYIDLTDNSSVAGRCLLAGLSGAAVVKLLMSDLTVVVIDKTYQLLVDMLYGLVSFLFCVVSFIDSLGGPPRAKDS